MVNKLRKMFKSEKGFTLVELLAVIVILGIIAAIAVPAIGNVIDNSKKEAHIANAQTFLEAGRLMSTTDIETDDDEFSLEELQTAGFLEDSITAPSGEGYDPENTVIKVDDQQVILATSSDHSYFTDLDKKVSELTKDDVDLDPDN